jgi:hypothetical protein
MYSPTDGGDSRIKQQQVHMRVLAIITVRDLNDTNVMISTEHLTQISPVLTGTAADHIDGRDSVTDSVTESPR